MSIKEQVPASIKTSKTPKVGKIMHLGEKGQTQATSVQGHQLRGGHRSKERACSHLSTFNYIPRQTAKTEILNTISFCPWNSILVGWWGWEMKGCRILLHGIFSLSGSINYLRYPGTNLYLLGWRHLSLTELQWLFSPRYILWISNNANGPKCCYKLKQLNGFSPLCGLSTSGRLVWVWTM